MKQTPAQKVASAVKTINLNQHQELMEEIRSIKKELAEYRIEQNKKWEEMEPVKTAFTGLNWSKTALIWILGLIGTITAIVLGLKQILNK